MLIFLASFVEEKINMVKLQIVEEFKRRVPPSFSMLHRGQFSRFSNGLLLLSHSGRSGSARTYLSTQSIAVSSVVGGQFSPFETRLEKLAHAYDRDLFHEKTLGSLAGGPRIYFNATNLGTGNMFFCRREIRGRRSILRSRDG